LRRRESKCCGCLGLGEDGGAAISRHEKGREMVVVDIAAATTKPESEKGSFSFKTDMSM